MESTAGAPVHAQMEELRLKCVGEIPIMQKQVDSVSVSFLKSLDFINSRSKETVQLQEKLKTLKAELPEAEEGMLNALEEKTKKEAKRMAVVESLSVVKSRTDQLKRVVEAQRARRDEYARIVVEESNDLKACEEKHHEKSEHKNGVEEAILWYDKNLGFRTECGSGVKFIFSNINMKKPHEEYSFTIRHESDTYALLDCNPSLNDTKELLIELNHSNGLYKFVTTMREKFQESALCGNLSKVRSHNQSIPTASVSTPFCSIPIESGSESLFKQRDPQAEEFIRDSKKLKNVSVGKSGLPSPGSA
ncbi:unnamed protein product [Cuscuta europaea]|uniref:Kinetochore protein SPC25 n=1 Tax=Cuscuta europaea TaxID=41803 RepID=A0A9P0ZJX1_CUSEU|nr:unnamed protein product [Cuscuta europaea]